MPVLSNPRHERFAQEVAKGNSATQAFIRAGYSANRGNATRLNANESVQRRVSELKDRAALKTEITVASLLAEAEQARTLAMELGQPSAAVAAIKEKGVLSGHRVEKRENTNRSLDQMSDAELFAIAAGSSAGAVAPEGGPKVTH